MAQSSRFALKSAKNAYLSHMLKAFEFCLPTKSTVVSAGPDWLHEIKYCGYRPA
jgi:bifunctional non-homologous end joining protein LigD